MLHAAVALADQAIDVPSMRTLAQELGVVPMALYKHVSDKDELIGGMVDVVLGEIEPPDPSLDWKDAVRARLLEYFEIGGAEDPRVIAARRRLTNLLY